MQHDFLRKCSGKPLILDTHFANPRGRPTRYETSLSQIYEKNGEQGADYREAPQLDEQSRKAVALLSSYDNPTSWWGTKDSILATLHDFGWPNVWMFDYVDVELVQRTFFVCYAIDSDKAMSGIRF
jgi:hypothetical protein